MNVRELLGAGPADVEVADLAFDNRAVRPGTVFFCVPGFTRDGHDFAPDAAQRGAVALVVERPLGLAVPEIVVDDVRLAMAQAAARFQGDPTARLRVAGVTGTNGKTTTTYLLLGVLEAAGVQTGLLGTVKSVVGGVDRVAKHTTPEAIDLQRTFVEMLAAGDAACVMEVSSHALELHRASGIHWAAAVFTNLTQDHLDFHPDMESYFLAKRRLFEAADGPKVINVDDPYGQRLAEDFEAITFGMSASARYRATELSFDASGSSFVLDGSRVSIPLPGRFNVANALGVLAAAEAMGVAREVAIGALARADRVPGRFEPVDEGQSFPVLVDYAHTPDSLENVLGAARELARGRVICVFGAGGDRDKGKRPLMGEIAGRLSDLAIVTSDNPRSEDPEAILTDIEAGMNGVAHEREVDRRVAIGRAIELAGEGDVVVIAGKGHEQGQEFADGRKEPFDDRVVAAEALRS
jgi:UDP-N-acetylmuramoyl-L-alanyl-D-glutamate--2,6-diaminopimelate ligase